MDTMVATAYPWSTMDTLYSIAGKFDGELTLVVWWLGLRNHQIILYTTRLMTPNDVLHAVALLALSGALLQSCICS